jgi:hypothetical protein
MSDDDPKLSSEAAKRILADARADEIADETAAMTPAEREAFIAKAGVTKAQREASLAKQRKKFEEAVAKQAKKPPVVEPPRPSTNGTTPSNVRSLQAARSARRAAIMSSGLTLAAAAVFVFILGKADMLPHGSGPTPITGAGPGNPLADGAREQALRAYVRGDWQQCLDDLDKAKELDPRGEEDDPTIQMARANAKRLLAMTKDGG